MLDLMPVVPLRHTLWLCWDEVKRPFEFCDKEGYHIDYDNPEHRRLRNEITWLYLQTHPDFQQQVRKLWIKHMKDAAVPWEDFTTEDENLHTIIELALIYDNLDKETRSGYNYELGQLRNSIWVEENHREITPREKIEYIKTHPDPVNMSLYKNRVKYPERRL